MKGRRIALVANPRSGLGHGGTLVEPVAQRLRAGGTEVISLQGKDAQEAASLCAVAVADGVDAVVALGGDGMVHIALQAVAGTSTALGIIPAGTGNDFALTLGLPLDPMAAVDVVLQGQIRQIDAARANDTWWCCVLGTGFDACVNERANLIRWPRGRRRYDLAILAELRTFRPLPYVLELDGQRRELEAMMVTVGNAPRYGGGMRIAPDALVDDGLLDVVIVAPVSRGTLVRIFPRVRKGTHISHPAVSVTRVSRVTLASPGQVAYADGERLGSLPQDVRVEPGSLRVLVPSHQ